MSEIGDLEGKIITETERTITDSETIDEDMVLQILLNSREQGQLIESMIKNQIEVKDEMIDKLHKELDYYKQDSADRFVDQLMKSVIKVRKDMTRLIGSDQWGDMSVLDIQREYQYVFEDLTDLLEQQNVDAFASKTGDEFDPAIHQAKIEPTDDPRLDKTIKKSLSEGYKKGGKVLQPERVIVYQYRA